MINCFDEIWVQWKKFASICCRNLQNLDLKLLSYWANIKADKQFQYIIIRESPHDACIKTASCFEDNLSKLFCRILKSRNNLLTHKFWVLPRSVTREVPNFENFQKHIDLHRLWQSIKQIATVRFNRKRRRATLAPCRNDVDYWIWKLLPYWQWSFKRTSLKL